ncbi:hypothetical protein BC828DRAFT_372518 [Blastocladiella britannica]|nr:hypothetical protein BC828DRAFT_372518 [Blastocladiella britannica]
MLSSSHGTDLGPPPEYSGPSSSSTQSPCRRLPDYGRDDMAAFLIGPDPAASDSAVSLTASAVSSPTAASSSPPTPTPSLLATSLPRPAPPSRSPSIQSIRSIQSHASAALWDPILLQHYVGVAQTLQALATAPDLLARAVAHVERLETEVQHQRQLLPTLVKQSSKEHRDLERLRRPTLTSFTAVLRGTRAAQLAREQAHFWAAYAALQQAEDRVAALESALHSARATERALRAQAAELERAEHDLADLERLLFGTMTPMAEDDGGFRGRSRSRQGSAQWMGSTPTRTTGRVSPPSAAPLAAGSSILGPRRQSPVSLRGSPPASPTLQSGQMSPIRTLSNGGGGGRRGSPASSPPRSPVVSRTTSLSRSATSTPHRPIHPRPSPLTLMTPAPMPPARRGRSASPSASGNTAHQPSAIVTATAARAVCYASIRRRDAALHLVGNQLARLARDRAAVSLADDHLKAALTRVEHALACIDQRKRDPCLECARLARTANEVHAALAAQSLSGARGGTGAAWVDASAPALPTSRAARTAAIGAVISAVPATGNTSPERRSRWRFRHRSGAVTSGGEDTGDDDDRAGGMLRPGHVSDSGRGRGRAWSASSASLRSSSPSSRSSSSSSSSRSRSPAREREEENPRSSSRSRSWSRARDRARSRRRSLADLARAALGLGPRNRSRSNSDASAMRGGADLPLLPSAAADSSARRRLSDSSTTLSPAEVHEQLERRGRAIQVVVSAPTPPQTGSDDEGSAPSFVPPIPLSRVRTAPEPSSRGAPRSRLSASAAAAAASGTEGSGDESGGAPWRHRQLQSQSQSQSHQRRAHSIEGRSRTASASSTGTVIAPNPNDASVVAANFALAEVVVGRCPFHPNTIPGGSRIASENASAASTTSTPATTSAGAAPGQAGGGSTDPSSASTGSGSAQSSPAGSLRRSSFGLRSGLAAAAAAAAASSRRAELPPPVVMALFDDAQLARLHVHEAVQLVPELPDASPLPALAISLNMVSAATARARLSLALERLRRLMTETRRRSAEIDADAAFLRADAARAKRAAAMAVVAVLRDAILSADSISNGGSTGGSSTLSRSMGPRPAAGGLHARGAAFARVARGALNAAGVSDVHALVAGERLPRYAEAVDGASVSGGDSGAPTPTSSSFAPTISSS